MPSDVQFIIDRIRSDSRCEVFSPSGRPRVESYDVPEDVDKFYSLCGGVIFFKDSNFSITVVGPDRFVKANQVVAGIEGKGDISFDWFLVAENGEQYVSIDLGPGRTGRCYDSFWDRHAVAGSSLIIATTFTELLGRIYGSGGRCWYWLESGFVGYGDAYK